MNLKQVTTIVICSVLSATIALKVSNSQQKLTLSVKQEQPITESAFKPVNFTPVNAPINFTHSASVSTPTVVHIKSVVQKSTQSQQYYQDDLFEWFFGTPQQRNPGKAIASGSGVIVSTNGYIVTNNHVIEGANKLEVTLSNNTVYSAELIGSDPDTDLALLKVDANNLPAIKFSDSDSVLVGEWVLAVGNPFNLSSTVTAGIVSAKGRSINILNNGTKNKANTAIESFIQTDAAVNPGNSGGALVNLNGELIGINTAIATPTGSYAGYSFAVPANLVLKVISDLKEYGNVQRGYLGISINEVNADLAKQLNLKTPSGVYIADVNPESGADLAGLKPNDVITSINGTKINSPNVLQEEVATYKPGDWLTINYIRDGKPYTASVQLKNKYNTVAVINPSETILKELGIELEEISTKQKQALRLNGGVQITKLSNGLLTTYTSVKENFIITHINDIPISNINEFSDVILSKQGKIVLEGIYPYNSEYAYLYAFKK